MTIRRREFVLLVAVLPLIGCRSDEGTPTTWEALALPGKTLELIDGDELMVLPFSKEGTSSAVIGLKKGPVAGPILFWKIRKNTLVISVVPDSDIFEELSDPAIKGNTVTVTRKSGVRMRYLLSLGT